jgi:hypothetical protein
MTCLGTTDPKTKQSVYSSSQSSIIATLPTARKEERASLPRKDPPGTPDLAARSTETRLAEEMRITDGEEEEEEEEEPARARIHPEGKADAAFG